MRIISSLLLIILGSNIFAQNPYYDAKKLSEYWDTGNAQIKASDTEVLTVLSNYAGDLKDDFIHKINEVEVKKQELETLEKNLQDLQQEFDAEKRKLPPNPALIASYQTQIGELKIDIKDKQDEIENLLKDIHTTISNSLRGNKIISLAGYQQSAQLEAPEKTSKNGILSAVGGINVTSFADGLAQFLVERAKEELTVTFFDKFKEELDSQKELQIMFPKTYDLLLSIDQEIYNISAYLNMLRETFKQDLKSIIPNLRRLIESDELNVYFAINPTVKYILVEALIVAEEFQNGKHPGDILKSLGENTSSVPNNLKNYPPSVKTVDLFSQSIKSKQDDRYWVPMDSVKMLLKNDIERKIFLGLLFQQASGIEFKNQNGSTVVKLQAIIQDFDTNAAQLSKYLTQLSQNAERIESALKAVKESNTGETKNYENHYQFYSATLDLIEQALSIREIQKLSSVIDATEVSKVNNFLNLARDAGSLYLNVTQQKYFSAVLDLSMIISDGITDDLKLYSLSIKDIPELLNQWQNLKTKPVAFLSNKPPELDAAIRKVAQLITALETLNTGENLDALKKHIESVRSGNIGDIDKLIAALSALSIPDDLTTTLKEFNEKLNQFPSKIMKYGNLAAGIVQAKSAEEAKNMIAAVALPAGSASIKKKTISNWSINAYVGAAYSYEKYNEGPAGLEDEYRGGLGLSTPVGVAWSHGIERRKVDKKKMTEDLRYSSLTVFVSLIDVGAIASFRFNPVETTEDGGQVSELPEIKLENIFAPGAYLVYGLPKVPISIGGGVQYAPQLRKVEVDPADPAQATLDIQTSLLRFQVFVGVDIPLFNLYSKTRD